MGAFAGAFASGGQSRISLPVVARVFHQTLDRALGRPEERVGAPIKYRRGSGVLYCSPWNTKPELVVLDRFASISVHVTPQEFLLPLTLFAQRVIDPAAAEVAGQISVHWKPKSLLITAAPAGAPITGHWETIWDAALSASVMRERSVLRNCEVLGFAVLYGFTQLRQPSLIATRRIARLQAERARLRERLEAVC